MIQVKVSIKKWDKQLNSNGAVVYEGPKKISGLTKVFREDHGILVCVHCGQLIRLTRNDSCPACSWGAENFIFTKGAG